MREIYASELIKGDVFYERIERGAFNLYLFLDEVQVNEYGEMVTYNCFDVRNKKFNYFADKDKVFKEV